MASLPSAFWGGWILVITGASFLALLWFVIDIYRGGGDGNEHEVWDENLREGAKPAPIWWFWFILGLMTISVVYVMLYPALGTYRGVLNWSMGSQLAQRKTEYDARFGAERQRILGLSPATLAADDAAMHSAWRVFNSNCSSCHGRDAAGQASHFPDLTDAAWQWGGEEEQIAATIRAGREGVMPGWTAAVGEKGIGQLADYVLALSGSQESTGQGAPGGVLFQQFCVACHGSDGSGNTQLGAPALNDASWTYGGSRANVVESIANGRNGSMPAFASRLDETQIRLLTAWLRTGAKMPSERELAATQRRAF
jgi:cytochrome c oxidase cbb3-type subunit 3